MKIGAYFFMLAKKNKAVPEIEPSAYVLFSEDSGLRGQIAAFTGKETSMAKPLDSILLSTEQNIEFIFDMELLHYKEVIAIMEKLKSAKATFKIAHKKPGFLIGSNSSTDRGKIIT